MNLLVCPFMIVGLGFIGLMILGFVGSMIISAMKNQFAKNKEKKERILQSWHEAIQERRESLHSRKIASDGVFPIIGCREFT